MDESGGSMKTFSGGVLRPRLGNSFREQPMVAHRLSSYVRMSLRVVAAMALLASLVALGSRAQDAASITGTVTDKTGTPVFDARVKLMDTRTGAVYESQTGSFGAYLFARA